MDSILELAAAFNLAAKGTEHLAKAAKEGRGAVSTPPARLDDAPSVRNDNAPPLVSDAIVARSYREYQEPNGRGIDFFELSDRPASGVTSFSQMTIWIGNDVGR